MLQKVLMSLQEIPATRNHYSVKWWLRWFALKWFVTVRFSHGGKESRQATFGPENTF